MPWSVPNTCLSSAAFVFDVLKNIYVSSSYVLALTLLQFCLAPDVFLVHAFSLIYLAPSPTPQVLSIRNGDPTRNLLVKLAARGRVSSCCKVPSLQRLEMPNLFFVPDHVELCRTIESLCPLLVCTTMTSLPEKKQEGYEDGDGIGGISEGSLSIPLQPVCSSRQYCAMLRSESYHDTIVLWAIFPSDLFNRTLPRDSIS